MGSNNIFIMHSESKFSFRNLQPINYLTQFNRMVEHTKRHPGESSARSDLNLVPLSKFPISKYYEDMEGIFQNLVRKKQEHGSPLRSREMIEEERFMEKHNEFMRKVLTKFIIHNQDRMGMYEKEKKSIKNNERAKNHFRTMSEPKSLKKFEPRPLQLPQISNLKASPAVGTTENNSPITLKDFKTHPQIVNLQLKQARKQSTFAQKIQQQISKFDKQMQIQAKQIREYRFWKEAEVAEVKAVKKQKKVEKSDGIEFEFSLKNFAST